MRLTPAGCAKLWLSANGRDKPQSWEGRAACVGCFTGAANAGQPIERAQEAATEWRTICPRCRRPSARMIFGEHCVSCYNRGREAAAGRDRKGHRPALSDQLHDERLMVLEGTQAPVVTAGHVLDAPELMVRTVKRAAQSIVFTRPAPEFADAQPVALWQLRSAAAQWDDTCQRCLRANAHTPKPSLFRATGLCISCYNREREVVRGTNRKGGRPRLASVLHARHLVVTEGAHMRLVAADSVTGAGELMVRAAKGATLPMIFTSPAPVFEGAA